MSAANSYKVNNRSVSKLENIKCSFERDLSEFPIFHFAKNAAEQYYYGNIETHFQSLIQLVTFWQLQMKFAPHRLSSIKLKWKNPKIQSIKRQSSKQNPLKLISLCTKKTRTWRVQLTMFPSFVWDASDFNSYASSFFAFRRQFVRAEWMMNLGKRSKSRGFILTKKKKFLRHKFISSVAEKMVSVLFNRSDLPAILRKRQKDVSEFQIYITSFRVRTDERRKNDKKVNYMFE